ncbi:Lipid transfer protein [Quillaja saponaria]|uniref:Lipid transfer protein n=1 Tax=Quillaja saponaria TaxID=32244 RepID=A0AAD7Q3E9_QUISA|nr:Lipid transfer protein [Quillaja saponaria]
MAFESHLSKIALALAYILMVISCAVVDSAKEAEECAKHLSGLASCLTYILGESNAPTSDCCSGLKQALDNNKKCLCLVVKDRDDPKVGINYNLTLALGLSSVCKVPGNPSQCIALLHLDPKSPEAKIFNQLGKNSNTGGSSSPAPSPTVEGSKDTDNKNTSIPAKNKADCYKKKRLMGLDVLIGSWILIILLFVSVDLINY